DFIEAVKKCQAAGITPLAAGGKDKWPLHFYPAMLMMRIMGKEGMQAAYDGKNGGFGSPEAIKAVQERLLSKYLRGISRHLSRRQNGLSPDGNLGYHRGPV